MDAPLTLTQIRHAVDTTANGLLHHQPITMDTWDHILPILIAAHNQTGGHTRALVRRLFDASYLNDNGHELADTLRQLQAHLPTPPPPAARTRRPQRARRANRTTSPHQLAFDTDDPGTAQPVTSPA